MRMLTWMPLLLVCYWRSVVVTADSKRPWQPQLQLPVALVVQQPTHSGVTALAAVIGDGLLLMLLLALAILEG